jgi:hypothetical protein
MHNAAKKGNLRLVEAFLTSSRIAINYEQVDDDGMTVLGVTCKSRKNDYLDIATSLVDSGYNPVF